MTVVHTSLDLNLFRVLLEVADTGSVTKAAARLYLTQSAVSAALRRLQDALSAQLVARHGRGVVLTERGAHLVQALRPHLDAMERLALAPARFEARTSDRTLRLGLSDGAESWLLPALMARLARDAPGMRLVCTEVQFRSLAEAMTTRRVDLAVAHAVDLPRDVLRAPLLRTRHACLFDPRHVRLGERPSVRAYLAEEHAIVSYNGDLQGVVEEHFKLKRNVRCSVASFSALGPLLEGSRLVATVPKIVATDIARRHRALTIAPLPVAHDPGTIDVMWPRALDGDEALTFVRGLVTEIGRKVEARST
jgi:LysR family transcriptional activator of mexEF-oprN operon